MVTKPLIAWSHSALEIYRTCPRKYYEAKISKAWVEEFKGPAAEFGVAAHKAFENRIGVGAPFPGNLTDPETLRQWEALAKKLDNISGMKLMENQLCLNNYRMPVDWYAKDAWVRVIVDLLILNNNGTTALQFDYKTGKKKDNTNQLALGAAVLFNKYPKLEKIVSAFVWLKGGVSMTPITFVRTHEDKLWGLYLPVVKQVEASITSGHWPEKRSGLCQNYCPVLECQHNGANN